MINQGDKFTFLDLQQSMREICAYDDIRKYIDNRQPNAIVLVGDRGVNPSKCSPDEYAAACILGYRDIPSSAIHLDQQLRDKGFKTTYKFSYKYRNGGLTSEQIVHDAYCLDWFQQLYRTSAPHKKYADKYFGAVDNAFRLSYYYAQYLWTQNWRVTGNIAGALRMPNESQWAQIISAILGIGFQFNPLDVYEYAIEHSSPTITKKQFDARYSEQLAFKKEMMDKYGIDTGCLVLSPQSRDKLHKIVTRTDTPYYLQVISNIILGHNR